MAQSAGGLHMTGIYKIENKLNGKVYIGQALDIELRWEQHKDALINSNKSWYPIAREESNTIDDFDFSILQTCKPEELDEIETYWVKKYNSFQEGYNKTRDGSYIIEQHKDIIDLSAMRPFTSQEWFHFMRDMNGASFKLWVYFYEKSKTNSYILKSPSIFSTETGISHKNTTTLIFRELESLGYLLKEDDKWIVSLQPLYK